MSEPLNSPPKQSIAVAPNGSSAKANADVHAQSYHRVSSEGKFSGLIGEVEADDNHHYYIKGDAHGRLVGPVNG